MNRVADMFFDCPSSSSFSFLPGMLDIAGPLSLPDASLLRALGFQTDGIVIS